MPIAFSRHTSVSCQHARGSMLGHTSRCFRANVLQHDGMDDYCSKRKHKEEREKVVFKRRAVLRLLLLIPSALTPEGVHASSLKSLVSKRASTLTFLNETDHLLKIYWNNYDADKEFFAKVAPAGHYTVDTWASHPWSIVDAETGSLVKEVVAQEGFHSVPIKTLDIQDNKDQVSLPSREEGSVAFDGVGGPKDDYTPAQIAEVRFDNNGAVVALKADGFKELLAIAIGPAEAFALYRTFGPETRRPSTLETWKHSLDAVGSKVERIVLTRLVGTTYYSRVVLKQADQVTSVDSRPSDSLALALQSKSPIFASKELMRTNDEETALAKTLQGDQIPDANVFPEGPRGRDLPGPDLSTDPGYVGAFSA